MELTNKQNEVINDPRNRLVIALSPGQGKSVCALMRSKKYNGVPFIVCPKNVVSSWQIESEKWGVGIEIMTKENIKKHPLPKNPGCIIIDESQNGFSTHTSQMAKIMTVYIQKYPGIPVMVLSGTPITRGVTGWQNIYALYNLFGYYLNYWSMRNFFQYQIRMGARKIWKDKNSQECIYKAKELFDKIAIQDYTEENKQNTHEIIEVPIQYFIPNEYNSYHDPAREENEKRKDSVIDKIIKEKDNAVIIVFYRTEIEKLVQKYNFPVISGDNPYVLEYKDVKKYPFVIVQMDSAVGWSLEYHDTMIYYSYSFKYSSLIQSRKRIDRKSYRKPNYYYYLTNIYENNKQKTIDQKIHEAYKNKKDFYDIK